MKEKDYKNAIFYFDKSLTEHRIPETLKKRQAVSTYYPIDDSMSLEGLELEFDSFEIFLP